MALRNRSLPTKLLSLTLTFAALIILLSVVAQMGY